MKHILYIVVVTDEDGKVLYSAEHTSAEILAEELPEIQEMIEERYAGKK